MSMSTVWQDGGSGEKKPKRITAPISLIVSAFAPVADIRLSLTPQLAQWDESVLLLIDLGRGKNRLGGSILAQVVSQMGETTPDVDSAADLKNFWSAIQQLGREKKLLAYHDRSDGGLLATAVEMAFAGHIGVTLDLPVGHPPALSPVEGLATAVEMAFAGHTGIDLDLPSSPGDCRSGFTPDDARNVGDKPRPTGSTTTDVFAQLFAEELGAVIQVRTTDLKQVQDVFAKCALADCTRQIGRINRDHAFRVRQGGKVLLDENLSSFRAIWSDVTRRISALRDNPACAESEYQLKLDPADPGITPVITFELTTESTEARAEPAETKSSALFFSVSSVPSVVQSKPPIAVLREQGVNGEVEMAAAFTRAGFRAIDVHMTDIISGRIKLSDFRSLVACGGFSYGDVLGGGEGWAKSILFNERARAEFAAFFAREDTLALGVCNGCQMMSALHSIIPGSGHWPRFVQNRSERFEARLVSVKIEKSPSVLFAGMEGSVLPLVTAHGEGFAEFADAAATKACSESGLVCARFVDNRQQVTEQYPLNPNSSPFGMTAFTTTTGRVTILMPHPERVFRTVQMSWHPADWPEDSPWMRLFRNARAWVG
jgi:phosphoribosylformylglycinamidine synthase